MVRLLSFIFLACLSTTGVAQSQPLPDGVVIRLRLIDPRLVTHTDTTFDIQYANEKSDVIGIRTLTVEESKELHTLILEECISKEETHLCGHSPIYAIEYVSGKELIKLITISGSCQNWACDDQLQILIGFKCLDFLEGKLPPPQVFKWALRPRIPAEYQMEKPFFDLEISAENPHSKRTLPNK
jgi:hypothetical protein